MTIQYITTQRSVKWLIDSRKKGRLFIPRHQRGFVWNLKHQRSLIDTIRRGLPIPSLTLSGTDLSGNRYSIEDGQQRVETLIRFCENKFDLEGVFFIALGEDGQKDFLEYKVPILIYTGATDEERIEIFDRLQNGIALSYGERFHAMRFLSPLVQYTCEILLYEEAVLQKTIEDIWGPRKLDGNPKVGDGTKRYRTLREAVCLVAGSLWGPEYYTENYDMLRDKLKSPLSEQAKQRSQLILQQIISIYTKAINESIGGESKLSDKALKDSFWNPKHFSGYILYSLWENQTSKQWTFIETKWVNFLVQYRKKPSLLKEKLLDVSYGLKDLELKYKAGWLSLQNKYLDTPCEKEDLEDEEDDSDE